MRRIGLLGGTFDPVHKGHLELAQKVYLHFDLDKIIFIPAAQPPHKNGALVCSVEHRLQMLSLALSGQPRFELSTIEISRDQVSYTFDTITQFETTSGSAVRYYFIIGFDALAEIETWYRWDDLLGTTNFIVAVRPGFSLKQMERLLERNGFSPDEVNADRWVGGLRDNEVLFLAGEIRDISSTAIRQKIAAGEEWTELVPSGVADYISRNRLYR